MGKNVIDRKREKRGIYSILNEGFVEKNEKLEGFYEIKVF
jgi:hypothetical protein